MKKTSGRNNPAKPVGSQLLLEIGVEELPLHHWDPIESGEWEAMARKLFQEHRLSFGQVRITTTPRRIVFLFDQIPAKQIASVKVFRGPSRDKAFDARGNPSEALQGFVRSKGVALDTLVEEKTEKGTYLIARIQEPAKKTVRVLPVLLKELVSRLTFPKNMRWESTGVRFSRPIRWVVALLDRQVIPFEIAGVRSGKTTQGHRFLAPKSVCVASIQNFEPLLEKNHVIVCRKTRQELIRADLIRLAGREGWDWERFDPELIGEAADLVEEPFLVTGAFDKNYLSLPSEVLATCMKKHQKIFACFDKKGKLVPSFVAVMNGRRRDPKKIALNYQSVLESRLRDARFFFGEDAREPLASKIEKLKGIVFLGKLGTVYEKMERMKALADFFKSDGNLIRAAELAKADLVTAMVYEFPELQGVMGREYALHDGENSEVARAVDAQYWPKSLSLDFRELTRGINRLGGLLAILEKVDTLVGAFGAGFIPTGSQDPYALRRAAGGVVKIIRAFGLSFSLAELLERSAALYGNKIQFTGETKQKLMQFFKERLAFELALKPGTREYEILEAVQATHFDDLANVLKRFEFLRGLAREEREKFEEAAKVVERTSNILKGIKGTIRDCVKVDLFREDLEGELLKLYAESEAMFRERVKLEDYAGATRLYGQIFYEPIHQFFDRVMVNVDDPEIRANRQALMKKINSLYVDRIADLSFLTTVESRG